MTIESSTLHWHKKNVSALGDVTTLPSSHQFVSIWPPQLERLTPFRKRPTACSLPPTHSAVTGADGQARLYNGI